MNNDVIATCNEIATRDECIYQLRRIIDMLETADGWIVEESDAPCILQTYAIIVNVIDQLAHK